MTAEPQIITNCRNALKSTGPRTLSMSFSAPADLIMQNKPNLPEVQMNITSLLTRKYENKSNWTLGENKPNSNPIKANFFKSPNECKLTYNKGLQKKRRFRSPEKQTQFKPKQSQF